MLFILTGLSGAGKSTVADALMQDASLGLVRFVTTTTRPPRPHEVNGVHYWFVSAEEFDATRLAGGFYESAEVYSHWYGSSKAEMERLLRGDQQVLVVLDVQGAKTLKTMRPEAVVIFLTAPLEQLRRRLEERNAPKEETERRLTRVVEELPYQAVADVVIENHDDALGQTLARVRVAIRERARMG